MKRRAVRTAAIPLLWLASVAGAQEPPGYAALQREFVEAVESGGDAVAVALDFAPRFAAAAAKHEGTETAVPFLVWIVEHAAFDSKTAAAAVDRLVASHAKSTDLEPVVARLSHLEPMAGRERVAAWLDAVVAESSHPEVQARAMFERARFDLGRLASEVTDEQREAALALLKDARKLAKTPALVAAIEAFDTSPRGLDSGDVAPDIAGLDMDGVPFRLSDYRGKVVVLDFWGDW